MDTTDWLIGVDVGGTFTDLYAFERTSGALALHKRPSTPDNPAEAILSGLRELAEKAGFEAGTVGVLAHGTTVATNALIQRTGAKVAVLTTKNFRDLLEIGRQVRPRLYDLKADHPHPLAQRQDRLEIDERIGAAGEVVTPLDEGSVDAALKALRDGGAKACAVCFLFSYLNPEHERAVGRRLAEEMPELSVSLSSDVQPEFREYERFSTTLLNAYLQPLLNRYMRHLKSELETLAPRARIGINQSSGGLMSPERAREFPVRTALSGPAAGAMGAVHSARKSGRPNVITLDMGGTSADVTLIRDHEVSTAFDREVAGFPVRLPMVDIHTVGAGGGSIAWFDRDGLMKVGPKSAGAVPGPACYGHGGAEPTVTDANVVLGRLSGRGLLGGAMALDTQASHAVMKPVAERLGFTAEKTAQGLLDIVTANMVRAIRAISVERGHDPRDFVLMPFGGAGPLHAYGCAKALGIREILVPHSPGILCAEGLLVADLSENLVRSQRFPAIPENHEAAQRLVDEMVGEAGDWWRREEIAEERRSLKLVVEMRYQSQNYELQVAVPVEGLSARLPAMERLTELFFEAHDRAYGFHNPDDPVDVVAVRLTAIGRLPTPGAPTPGPRATTTPEPVERRNVWFADEAPHYTPVYERDTLSPGAVIEGPAVIDQFDATTLVFPGDVARVDDALNLMIEVET
ncbi:hydantoinase/oxoprolinase family protein [Lutibaculum baratangense]|uniref:N-methylhydantoinase A n=1 Tax=Lutibaculum baratangense AMV1 TaxID=631454 RepID=V4RKU9_9HYPH|nr:hydantoinase/oxoprolinase family protein [Lutibaculum baratangense]ESR25914.1 N-methylhydantoinase A [Lutibaculum baratangense AMV1]